MAAPSFERCRKSPRLIGYDYAQAGAYFITVCTHNRVGLFGEIVDGVMQLNTAGHRVQSVWLALPTHYPGVGLDAFVVMPNHVHGVLWIASNDNPAGVINHAPTSNVQLSVGAQFIAPDKTMPLGKIVRAFKAKTTFVINPIRQTRGTSIWQRGYYDHIIRHEDDLTRIRHYIDNNPAQWEHDQENPLASIHGKPQGPPLHIIYQQGKPQ